MSNSSSRKHDRNGYIQSIGFVTFVLILIVMNIFYESRPGPHYALGMPPGTICTHYGNGSVVLRKRSKLQDASGSTAIRATSDSKMTKRPSAV